MKKTLRAIAILALLAFVVSIPAGAAKLCNEGKTNIGAAYLAAGAIPTLYVGLYKNTTEPAETVVMTGITEQTTAGSGYARIALTTSWTEDGTIKGQYSHAQITFTASGANWTPIYGYFITTAATGTAGKLIAVEHFATPAPPWTVMDGGTLKITPVIKFETGS